MAREANQDGWVKLFQTKGAGIPGTPYNALWQNKDLPTLIGWMITAPFTGTTRVVADRNPYYFKVDPAGNQLPYIDRYTADLTQDAEVMLLKAINGELDLVYHKINNVTNKAVFTDNLQKANYKFYEVVGSGMNGCIIALNINAKDPVKRQIFQNKDFRIGLSHAINRQQIIDVVYVGQGEPWQAAPRRETASLQRDAGEAVHRVRREEGQRAPRQGLPQEERQGLRLGPDDQPIAFVVEVAGTVSQAWLDTINLIQPMWRKVGWRSRSRTRTAPSSTRARTPTSTTRRSGAATAACATGCWTRAGTSPSTTSR